MVVKVTPLSSPPDRRVVEPGTRRAEHRAGLRKRSTAGASARQGQPPHPPFIASVNGMRLARQAGRNPPSSPITRLKATP